MHDVLAAQLSHAELLLAVLTFLRVSVVLILIALGFGPPFCGWCIDMLSQNLFAGQGLGDFFALCPGGVGAAGAGPVVDAACKLAVAEGTRQGIIINLLIYAWAGVHYLLAAITLPKDMATALASAAED